jgi:hypothetical protein
LRSRDATLFSCYEWFVSDGWPPNVADFSELASDSDWSGWFEPKWLNFRGFETALIKELIKGFSSLSSFLVAKNACSIKAPADILS